MQPAPTVHGIAPGERCSRSNGGAHLTLPSDQGSQAAHGHRCTVSATAQEQSANRRGAHRSTHSLCTPEERPAVKELNTAGADVYITYRK
ncbi:hypothetical protein NDU88_010328 [Pleurodeles waltl]|uniref:Uncharacterized protein n=1 Tax=Pleurodeles waltl TaxID=8319 RepID=A0AAV7S3P4_PLEWA|nr:hypothetical protein NDU88_010328 [Pleurodeles waltl]